MAAVTPTREASAATGTEVLHLDGVRVQSRSRGPGVEVSLRVAPGEVLMLRVTDQEQGTLIADACVGAAATATGATRFLGRDWSVLDHDEVNALRALVGRVFPEGNWLEHLSVAENVLLPLRHHTRLSESHLAGEAAKLARLFGLVGLPLDDVSTLDRATLQRAACVRAFLGSPRLVILEHPTAGAWPALLAPLVTAIRSARDLGTAVLWITTSEVVWREGTIPLTRRLRVLGGALVESGGPA